MINNDKNTEPHPCQYCDNPCYGLQCKNCHIKMVKDRSGICIDCNLSFFNALRKDGTKRQRCNNCQTEFEIKNIVQCPDCDKPYDGRIFQKCLECHKKSFRECESCPNMIKSKYVKCGECFRNDKPYINMFPLIDCGTIDCLNKTTYKYCKVCSLKNNYL